MDFNSKESRDYINKHTQNEPDLLKELNRETNLKILQPRMLSGSYQGRLLSLISKIVNPYNILEIGTYTGYSTICLAEGINLKGKIHTIDINEELYDFQKKYFNKSNFKNNIVQHIGNALDIIPKFDLKFDLIFLDADKPNYPNYFNILINKLNPGGVLLSDNVLWDGKIFNQIDNNDSSSSAIIKYNKLIAESDDLESIILPIRDGITISRKKIR